MVIGYWFPPHQSGSERTKVFVCEGSSLSLSCPSGTYLHFVRANFGRFSLSVCPATSPSSPSWSTRCLQPTTLRQLTTRCGGQGTCDLKVDSATFGDPCPETRKYLQLVYSCERAEEEEVASMVPPWLMPMEEMVPSIPSLLDSTTTTTTTNSPPSTEFRNRFFSYMEKIKKESLEEKMQRRVNTLIEIEEELLVEKELEAVPYLGEEELAQQKEILMIATISLMIVTILLCIGLALGRHFKPKKLPPTIYYEGSAYLDIQPPSPQYTPFLRNSLLPTSLALAMPTTMPPTLPTTMPTNLLTSTPTAPNPKSSSVLASQEYDYIDFPVKLTQI